MRHGVDVCVDNPKPAQQAALNVASVRFLQLVTVKGKAFTLDEPLDDQVDALAQRLGRLQGVANKGVDADTGMKSFEFP